MVPFDPFEEPAMRIEMITPCLAGLLAAFKRFSHLALWVMTLVPDFVASKERRTMAWALLRAVETYRRPVG
jgi:hypothetical protein